MYQLIPALLAILFALALWFQLKKKPGGTEKMFAINKKIKAGALVFLNKEYEVLIFFTLIAAALLTLFISRDSAIAFLFGAVLSAAAGNIGMRTATSANVRTAQACRKDLMSGMRIAFSSGAIMGMMVTGLGIIGVYIIFLISNNPATLFGFGFGASAIALFARVGGGIYTKAADIGADVVGKIEKNMDEDDPRNPAVIADNVGDNVGDVAGMGADLFESYVDSIIAAIIIGIALNMAGLPIIIAGAGIIASIIGYFFVRGKEPDKAMNRGIIVSTLIVIAFALFFIPLNIALSIASGLIAGILIGFSTEYYTSARFKPVKTIAEASKTGAATNVISGLSVGMMSTILPVIIVSIVIIVSFSLAGLFGIAMAAVGMLSTLGIALAMDCYGPVADNAAGIAEMAGLGSAVRKRAEKLDSVGNTTAAIGKGFAIGSAALTSIALFSAYIIAARIQVISITSPIVVVGIFIGALMPFFFSSVTLSAVREAASKIIDESRREIKRLHGKKEADYKKCIAISTQAGLKKMMLPALSAIIVPILIGVLLGKEALGGLLVGSIASGFMLAVMMANSGGAWDNAKKSIEAGKGGKGTEMHKASVVGDTVGDPLKDTAGPSLNILIKLMAIVALVFVPLLT